MKFHVCLILLVTSALVMKSSAFRIRNPDKRCPRPPTRRFTYRSGCRFPYTNGETCTYQCRPGYSQVSGSNQVNCTFGAWLWNPLECVLGCVNPPTVPGTTRFGCSPFYSYGENCYYKCNNGNAYCKEVSGDYIRRCLPNGHWSGSNLVCDCFDEVGCCRPDIVFVLDYSGSIPSSDFVKVKNFVNALVDRFEVGVLDAQIGLIRYSTPVYHEFHLNTHDNKADVLDDVDLLPISTTGFTNTGAALTYVANTMLQPTNGDRPDAPDTVIVLTDGISTDSVPGPASVLHEMGVQTFAIGVGPCTSLLASSVQLNQIASCSDYVYSLPDFNTLESVSETMHDQICCHKKNNACPSGYKWRNGICYKAFDAQKNFGDATLTCVANGGTLAMPKDASINAFLLSLKNAVNPTWGFWFGLTDELQEGIWGWVDGTLLGSYNAWGYPEPNNANGNEDCAEFPSTYWNDNLCSRDRRFICQTIPAGCPNGYVYHQPSQLCYKAFNVGKTYNDAVVACSSDGGTLATPRNPTTNRFLIYLKNAVDNNGIFRFGLTDFQPEGTWVWVDDNAPLGGFQPWAFNEPNNAGNEDCVEYFQGNAPGSHRNKWNDGPCNDDSRKFICQVRPIAPICCPKPTSGSGSGSGSGNSFATAQRLSPPLPPAACRPPADEEEGEAEIRGP